MKFITDFLNSGTVKQQNRKKLGALLICITAALLAVALIVLTVAAIAGAIKNKGEDEEEETGPKIPSGYVTTTFEEGQSSNGDLLLLDEAHPYVGGAPTVVLMDTEENRPYVNGDERVYYVENRTTFSLTEAAMAGFLAMVTDFFEETGDNNLYVSQAYEADVASELHKNGCTVTLKYYADLTADPIPKLPIYDAEAKAPVETYQWIYDNAAKYGFVRASNVEGEENIFRYVGAVHAKAMQDKKLTTVAEYITYLQTKHAFPSQLGVTVRGADGKDVKYGVYYIAPDADQYVPEEGTYDYTVSGDNMGGYIVTVTKTKASKPSNTTNNNNTITPA